MIARQADPKDGFNPTDGLSPRDVAWARSIPDDRQ
jgi:hypothetical protein